MKIFLRQHEAEQWTKDHPLYQEFTRRKISTMEQFREFILWALDQNIVHGKCPKQAAIVANGALRMINITSYLLHNLLQKQAEDFEQNGGFSERMMQVRLEKRGKNCP